VIGNGHAGFGRAASEKDPQRHLADVVPRPSVGRPPPSAGAGFPDPPRPPGRDNWEGSGPRAHPRIRVSPSEVTEIALNERSRWSEPRLAASRCSTSSMLPNYKSRRRRIGTPRLKLCHLVFGVPRRPALRRRDWCCTVRSGHVWRTCRPPTWFGCRAHQSGRGRLARGVPCVH
jgi:hypothetical protein